MRTIFRRPPPILPAFVLILGLTSVGASANGAIPPSPPEDASLPDTLSTVVVTATRLPESLSQIPQSISVLSAADIRRRQARTPNQMLAEVPGVWSVQSSPQGSPIIRGQIGNRVLYLWDGIRINNGALFSGPNGFFNQFPIGTVSRMEVLRGSGAVQYGSDAIGGIINIIGKQSDPFAAAAGTSADVSGRFGSVDNEQTGSADFSAVGARFAGNIGFGRQDVGDYRGPVVGRMANTGFKSLGGHAGVAWKATDDQTLRLSIVSDERTDVETYAQSKLNAGGIPRVFGPYERRWLAKADYDVANLGRFSQSLKLYSYLQDYASSRVNTNEAATNISRTLTLIDQQITGVGIQNTASIGAAKLTLGADGRFERLASGRTLAVTSKSTGAVVNSVPNGNVPDGDYDVLDAFALAEIPLGTALNLNLGARYEQVHINSNPAPEDALTPFTVNDLRLNKKYSAPTFSAGLLYTISRSWSLAANIASGFRAPTYSDTLSTGVPVFATGVASVPSPNVAPEYSRSYELSARYAAAHGWGSLTAYRMNLKDLLVSVNSGTIAIPGVGTVVAQQRANTGKGLVTGLEFDAGWEFANRWTLFGNATYTYGQDEVSHVPLRFIPPLNGRLGLRHESDSQRWWAEGIVAMAQRLRRHAPQDEIDAGFSTDPALGSPNTTTNKPYRSDFSIPGFAVVNLRMGGRLRERDDRHVDVTLNLNNLLNASYREAYAQQQLVAPGFNAVLGLSVSF